MRSNPLLRHVLLLALAGAAAVPAAGCGRSPRFSTGSRSTGPAPDPRADAARSAPLAIAAPSAPGAERSRSARLREAAPIAPADSNSLPHVPGAPAPVPEAAPSASAPVLSEKFTPPVLRQPCSPGRLPGGKRGQVELELRVNEDGVVDQFRYTSGSVDTVAVRAALDCVRVLRFDPATRGGKAVPAWCRQTFTFTGK